MSYDVGDTARIDDIEIKVDGALTDPATLAFTVRSPSGVVTIGSWAGGQIVRDGVGRFHADVPLTEAGAWPYKVTATAPSQVLGGLLVAVRTDFDRPAGGLTLHTLKSYLDVTKTVDDALLATMLDAAVEVAAGPAPLGTGRQLTPDPADGSPLQRRIAARGRRFVWVPDAREITQVLADDVAIPAGDYETLPHRGLIVRLELPDRCDILKVTGRWGYSVIPPDLADAIYAHAARNYRERDALYADQVALDDGGQVVNYFRAMPARVKAVYASYQLPGYRGLA